MNPEDKAPSAETLATRRRIEALMHLGLDDTRPPSDLDSEHRRARAVDALVLDLADPEQRDFGEYELIELLGKGGMGVVYRARQKSLDREVALKLLIDGLWAAPEFVERLRREARAAARMQHPNIVEVYDTGEFEGLHYISMRLVIGDTLQDQIRSANRLAPKHATKLVRRLAEAVDYAHRLGILHLDLKPANILIDANGEPLVADFGLAQRVSELAVDGAAEVSGTPSYMAPEQVEVAKNALTVRTDVYALGGILYHCLTGQPPLQGGSAEATMQKVVSDPPQRPRAIERGIPAELEAICLKCLEKSPMARYASAAEVADDLRRFSEGQGIEAVPRGWRARVARQMKRHSVSISGLALASILPVFVLGVWLSWKAVNELTEQMQQLGTQLLVSAFSEDDSLDEARVITWLESRQQYHGKHASPGVSTMLQLAPDNSDVVMRLLSEFGRALQSGGNHVLGGRVEAFAVEALTREAASALMKRDIASLGMFQRYLKYLDDTGSEHSADVLGAFLDGDTIPPRDAVDAVYLDRFCKFVKSTHPRCLELASLISQSGRSVLSLELEQGMRMAQHRGTVMDANPRLIEGFADVSGSDVGNAYFINRLVSRGLPLSALLDKTELAALAECKGVAPADETQACQALLDRTRLELQSKFNRFRAIARWCVPLDKLESFAREATTTPLIEFIPRIIARHADCGVPAAPAPIAAVGE